MTPRFAVFSALPRFEHPIHIGQQFFPGWPEYEAIFRDIFARQYYTNHGPLAQQLEQRLADELCVRHAMCVTNEFIGLALLGQALDLRGSVVVPGHAFIGTRQSLAWTDAMPLASDVDPQTGLMTAELVAPLLARQEISGILAVNPWGDACDIERLEELARRNRIPLYVDSSHGFGCAISGRPVGGFGAAEVISFHSDNIVGACEGGVICTEDDALASRVRNMRSNYGMGAPVPVAKTGNGRLSEAQAALALYNLDHYAEHRERNVALFEAYKRGLADIPGLSLRVPRGVSASNYQNVICLIDEEAFGLARDDLWRVLCAENLIVGRGFHPSSPGQFDDSADRPSLTNARFYSSITIELPTSRTLLESDIRRITDLIATIHASASDIRFHLGRAP